MMSITFACDHYLKYVWFHYTKANLVFFLFCFALLSVNDIIKIKKY